MDADDVRLALPNPPHIAEPLCSIKSKNIKT